MIKYFITRSFNGKIKLFIEDYSPYLIVYTHKMNKAQKFTHKEVHSIVKHLEKYSTDKIDILLTA